VDWFDFCTTNFDCGNSILSFGLEIFMTSESYHITISFGVEKITMVKSNDILRISAVVVNGDSV
jgi:hypothetical protein